MAKLEIYKPGQGKYTRLGTLLGVMLITLIGAAVLSEKLMGYALTSSPYARYGIPTLIVIVVGILMLWLVNRPASVDFFIATESEMKKVSWSSRKEIIGSTKVVIVTTLIMSIALFMVDLLFVRMFIWMKVL